MKRKELDQMYSGMQNAFYGQVDPRRRQELKDSRMVQESRRAIANLPEEPKHHEFNQNRYVERFKNDMYEITGD